MHRSPSEDEAAAIAAAMERFLAETAPRPSSDEGAVSPWQRAALLEGVSAKRAIDGGDGQGGDGWLS
jgi:hypothetical protein